MQIGLILGLTKSFSWTVFPRLAWSKFYQNYFLPFVYLVNFQFRYFILRHKSLHPLIIEITIILKSNRFDYHLSFIEERHATNSIDPFRRIELERRRDTFLVRVAKIFRHVEFNSYIEQVGRPLAINELSDERIFSHMRNIRPGILLKFTWIELKADRGGSYHQSVALQISTISNPMVPSPLFHTFLPAFPFKSPFLSLARYFAFLKLRRILF